MCSQLHINYDSTQQSNWERGNSIQRNSNCLSRIYDYPNAAVEKIASQNAYDCQNGQLHGVANANWLRNSTNTQKAPSLFSVEVKGAFSKRSTLKIKHHVRQDVVWMLNGSIQTQGIVMGATLDDSFDASFARIGQIEIGSWQHYSQQSRLRVLCYGYLQTVGPFCACPSMANRDGRQQWQ